MLSASTRDDCIRRTRHAVEGLSIGDSFGQHFFFPWSDAPILKREVPPPTWYYTDDTEMALAIVSVLEDCDAIDQDRLAKRFAQRFLNDPSRGYGDGARRLLSELIRGADWRDASRNLFGGSGSYGNGGAMRAAPIGAWFADDYDAVVEQARRSAEVTHAHSDGQAGAIAVAVAAAWACRWKQAGRTSLKSEMFDVVLAHTPDCRVRDWIQEAAKWALNEWHFDVAKALGNGSQVTAQDTVPFCLWAANRHLDDFVEAMWTTVSVGGDVDTTCAIVGSIVACAIEPAQLPSEWRASRESLNW